MGMEDCLGDYLVNFELSYQIAANSPEEARERALEQVYKLHINSFNAAWVLKNHTGEIQKIEEFLNKGKVK